MIHSFTHIVTPPKGGEIRKTSESINGKTTRYLHNILQTSKYPKVPMLYINDDLPEVRHLDQDSQALVLEDGRRYRWDALRKVMLGAGVVVAACLPGLVDGGQTTRQSVCGIG